MSTNLLLKSTKLLLDEIDKLETFQRITYTLKNVAAQDYGNEQQQYNPPQTTQQTQSDLSRQTQPQQTQPQQPNQKQQKQNKRTSKKQPQTLKRGAENAFFDTFNRVDGLSGIGELVEPIQNFAAGDAPIQDPHAVSSAISSGRFEEDHVGQMVGSYLQSGVPQIAARQRARQAMGALRKYAPGLASGIDKARQSPVGQRLAKGASKVGQAALEAAGGYENLGQGVGVGLKMARTGEIDPALFKVLGTSLNANARKLADYLRRNPRASQNPTLMRYVNGLFPAKSITQLENIIYKMIAIANEEEREIITKGLLFVTRDEVLKSIKSYENFNFY